MNWHQKISFICLMVFLPLSAFPQSGRIGAGLSFSSGVDYNKASTGNPGIMIKGYYKVNKRFDIVPSFTLFNMYNKGDAYYNLKNYMFHFDIDGKYKIFRDDGIVIYGLAGINGTTVISRYKVLIDVGGVPPVEDAASIKPGLNLGAGLKMHIDKSYDAVVQAKYIAGGFSQFVISLGVIYHINGNNRKTW